MGSATRAAGIVGVALVAAAGARSLASFSGGAGVARLDRAVVETEETPDACYVATAVPVHEGFGWSHYVDVANGCDRSIFCDVATNLDPLPSIGITVHAGETQRVRVRRESSTSEYRPVVWCHYT